MTSLGLENVLTIFGEALLMDYFLLRPLAIVALSFYTVRKA
jgi:hypothetical protein